MTEADWLKGKDPEGMLAAVSERLSPRQWHLLACAFARRVWDILPDGPLREAIEWCELHAGAAHQHDDLARYVKPLELATESAREAARHEQRDIVASANPDEDPESFRHGDARKTNPAAPLFQAACRYASHSLDQASDAVGQAAGVVSALLQMAPGEDQLSIVRSQVIAATRIRAAASLDASSALKLKAAGDEAADLENGRNVNVRYAAALQTVTREEESSGTRRGDLEEQKQKADSRSAARYLQDLAGNPFQPYRFEPAWRTGDVLGLAKAIYAERAFDRMPILADALLDADCDEESVLRHCRGTEAHAPEGPAHCRGCWVIERILEGEPAFFALPPMEAPKPKPAPPNPLGGARRPGSSPGGWDRLLQALQQADEGDDDDQ